MISKAYPFYKPPVAIVTVIASFLVNCAQPIVQKMISAAVRHFARKLFWGRYGRIVHDRVMLAMFLCPFLEAIVPSPFWFAIVYVTFKTTLCFRLAPSCL